MHRTGFWASKEERANWLKGQSRYCEEFGITASRLCGEKGARMQREREVHPDASEVQPGTTISTKFQITIFKIMFSMVAIVFRLSL